ncbi:class I SAM-dependent methyltransferase [Panacibacter ginsenosidivorans]|uniref:Class I SAM-dependent methyltransferase n=1 Tax=Panacibacter ginsenosidivorans TaxID=1813871 RepID=A0A5B8VDJ6_9BACT|nr:class I SAM-dependent methyltransferase [Panacibacter ginsenosidivorans]QEC69073.1 class I SAM-dependent methyltransferase [Panacibacter ginsenosidivorans]
MLSFLQKQKKHIQYDQAGLATALARVTGQISHAELFTLYRHALQLSKGAVVVEIGSYRGKSSIALGLAARQSGARVYCIDPHDDYVGVAGGVFGPVDLKDKIANIQQFDLGDIIFPVCLSSFEVGKIWSKPIDLLWIDGDHSYTGVSTDFYQFSVHVKKNGILIFHDSHMEGIKQLMSEIDINSFRKIGEVDSMTIYERR